MPSENPTRHYTETRDGWRITLYHHPPRDGQRGLPIVLCHGMGSNRYNMDGPGRTSLARTPRLETTSSPRANR